MVSNIFGKISPFSFDDYLQRVSTAESNGRDTAKNPRSSASGRYQFIDSTWGRLARAYPELGLTAENKNDPEAQRRAMEAFTAENLDYLHRSLGRTPTQADAYGAHHFGAAGYSKIANTADDTPVEQVLSANVIKANPIYAGKTIGFVKQFLNQKMGSKDFDYGPAGAGEDSDFEFSTLYEVPSDAISQVIPSLVAAPEPAKKAGISDILRSLSASIGAHDVQNTANSVTVPVIDAATGQPVQPEPPQSTAFEMGRGVSRRLGEAGSIIMQVPPSPQPNPSVTAPTPAIKPPAPPAPTMTPPVAMGSPLPPLQDGGTIQARPPVKPLVEGPAPATQAPLPPQQPILSAAMGANSQQERPGFFQWLASPDNADAMLRLGAGILSGKDFNEGLARGALGFADSVSGRKKTRIAELGEATKLMELGVPPDRAIAAVQGRDDLKDLAFGAGLPLGRSQQGNTYVTKGGREIISSTFNPTRGFVYRNEMTGEVLKSLPKDAMRIENAGLNREANHDVDDMKAARDAAIAAPRNMATYDSLSRMVDQIGAGSDIPSQVGRALARYSGVTIGNTDPEAMSKAQLYFSRLELSASEAMRGQGAITENERTILRESIPNMSTQPDALKKVLETLNAIEQRKVRLYENWLKAPAEVKSRGFGNFQFEYERSNAYPQVDSSSGWNTTPNGIRYRVVGGGQ
ncbi:hypothetical protein GAY31_11435 [Azospirillum brasilense]|nr:hypothetical protein [Azospirillum brasilense]